MSHIEPRNTAAAALAFALVGAGIAWAAPAAKPAVPAAPAPVIGPIEPVVPVPRAMGIRPPASMRRFAATTREGVGGMDSARPLIFEGRLLDESRRRVTGTYLLHFHFYDAPSGGRRVWTESRYVAVNNGVYAIRIPAGKELLRSGFSPGDEVLVEPPVGTSWRVSQPPYFVQAGSFEEPERAMRLHYDLRMEFGHAVIANAEVDGKKHYQVRVGPFQQRLDAEDIAWWLQTTGHEALIVMADR